MLVANGYIGQILQGGWNFAPRGTALCNGQLLPIQQNAALFSLLGTTFGGNGTTNFQLPNLQSRSMMHWGTGPGLSTVVLGESSGNESVTLTTTQMPAHTHTATFTSSSSLNATTTKGTTQGPAAGSLLAKAVDTLPGTALPLVYTPAGTNPTVALAGLNVAGTVTNSITGNNAPVPTRSPYQGITHVISLQGIFPSRS